MNPYDMLAKDLMARQSEVDAQAQFAKDIAMQQASQKQNPYLPALAKLTDVWTGSNFSQQVKEQDPLAQAGKVMALQNYAANQQRALDKSKIDVLKAATKGTKGKTLTTSALDQLSDLKVQYSSADQLLNDWEKNVGKQRQGGGGLKDLGTSMISQYDPFSPEAQYKDTMKLKAQIIGKALEGGKLTDVDYEKYLKFIPGPGDTKERAAAKIKSLKNEMATKYNVNYDTYSQAGYDLGSLNKLQTGTPAPQKEESGDKFSDPEFLAWKKSKGL